MVETLLTLVRKHRVWTGTLVAVVAAGFLVWINLAWRTASIHVPEGTADCILVKYEHIPKNTTDLVFEIGKEGAGVVVSKLKFWNWGKKKKPEDKKKSDLKKWNEGANCLRRHILDVEEKNSDGKSCALVSIPQGGDIHSWVDCEDNGTVANRLITNLTAYIKYEDYKKSLGDNSDNAYAYSEGLIELFTSIEEASAGQLCVLLSVPVPEENVVKSWKRCRQNGGGHE